jgi:AAHS family 3-hydroxyphenylpropionic acid transporter
MLHLLLNWMPSLMVAKGFTKSQSFLIQIIFNLSSATGSVALGWLMQRHPSRADVSATFCRPVGLGQVSQTRRVRG